MIRDAFELEVPAGSAADRLDRFLVERLEGWTRSAIARLVRQGRVTVDGRPAAKPGQALRPGSQVRLTLPPPPVEGPVAESLPLKVIHEDEHVIVVSKPAGMVVHEGHGRRRGTLVNALLGRGTPLAPAGGPKRPGIVHRLDGGTSGLLAVAKTDLAFHALRRAFTRREVRKRYQALVWGRPRASEGRIERPIGRSRSDALKMSVRAIRGRPRAALSHYRLLEPLPGFALLEIVPETGRTHQIRVHLQSIGHPVVGDERYGGRPWRGVQDPLRRKALREFDRLALHACDLAFAHPATGELLRLHDPLPDDLLQLIETLRCER